MTQTPKQRAIQFFKAYLETCEGKEQIITEDWLREIMNDHRLMEEGRDGSAMTHFCNLLDMPYNIHFILTRYAADKLSDYVLKSEIERKYEALQAKAISEVKKELKRIGRALDTDKDLSCFPLRSNELTDTLYYLHVDGTFEYQYGTEDFENWFERGGSLFALLAIHKNLLEL